jgi:small subunit ribosomal protein S16
MAVKMRLRREGKRKQPFYRVVVADARSPRDGRFIEDIGYYQPLREPSAIEIKRERALYWLGEGVQPSDAVRQLLRVTGIWEEFRPGDVGRQRASQQAAAAAAAKVETSARASRSPDGSAAARADERAEAVTDESAEPGEQPAEGVGEEPAEGGAATEDEATGDVEAATS